jgi:hypothetical protein
MTNLKKHKAQNPKPALSKVEGTKIANRSAYTMRFKPGGETIQVLSGLLLFETRRPQKDERIEKNCPKDNCNRAKLFRELRLFVFFVVQLGEIYVAFNFSHPPL